ncbi:cytosolic carboxypeptidase 1-like [Gigantopelta aegis]|uniref:cytosolic carboxypeptidase 1-like n=1 Tax=Gigantopelta aegis TaxID=1735272 RepID=UPI001B88D8A1|nr:cytosolic carboxypeptidase 1-like [Gigantopelta aegis]XP_041369391.1 cytosolic carboxypeptidase 1-like [Gigantopelta aegis]
MSAVDELKGPDKSSGTRVSNLMQMLEKTGTKPYKKQSTEDIHQIKYITSKLYQIITSQDKLHRDLFLKTSNNVDTLVATLQNTGDEVIMHNVVSMFIELIGKSHVGKRASLLVNRGVSTVLFHLLKHSANGPSLPDGLLMDIHLVLSSIGHKDRKFGVKARLNKALPLTLGLIKSNLSHLKSLQFLLQVFKLYTNNSVNASYLGKHNSINILFRVISLCGRKHLAVLKLALDNLNNLTKSKSNSARTIGMGGVPTILSFYSDWHQTDTKHRHINLRKVLLHILKNITNLRSGRKSFVESEGIRILYETCHDLIDCRDMEGLILLASLIMRKCCPRNKLPLKDMMSAIVYPLPASDFHIPDCGCLTDDQTVAARPISNTDDSDHSSMDDDDDIDSDDERFRTDNSDEQDDEQGDGLEAPEQRSSVELNQYEKFFPEMFDFMLEAPSTKKHSVYIPTALLESFVAASGGNQERALPHRRVKSSSNLREMQQQPLRIFSARSDSGHLKQKNSDESQPDKNHCGIPESDGDIEGLKSKDLESGATAVNLKTGSSVFSLDNQFSQSAKSFSKSASVPQKMSSKKLKSPKKSQPTKDKKCRRSRPESEFTGALCITPIPVQHELYECGTSSSSTDEGEDDEMVYDSRLHVQCATQTKSAFRFEKLAYPDLHNAKGSEIPENFFHRKFGVQRAKIFEDIDRMIHCEYIIDKVVYDMDQIVVQAENVSNRLSATLSNRDEVRVGRPDIASSVLRFNSQFECGNLRKVIQVREFEYDLILNPDVNTNHHHQWFYFEVSNMIADVPYRFNIVNCEKLNSQLNFGMKPLLYSVAEAMEGRGMWKRSGTDICYYKNHFIRSSLTTGGVKGKSYYTATFTLVFKYNRDVCYLAYHYPYSYTTLKVHLQMWDMQCDPRSIYYNCQTLCETISGNALPVITITAQPKTLDQESIEEFRSRPYIFLSGRVHPGESNSSWVMKGTIDFLMSKKPQAQHLRELFIFKIVPMLNPDGVINGNHRCSLVAEDLNRRWHRPCPKLHPTIYHTKGLLMYMNMVKKTPLVFCDYHGHSRKKNIFMYGCSPNMSWILNDTNNPASSGNKMDDYAFKTLPRLLQTSAPGFSIQNCSFVVERSKETTARVVVWRHIGIVRSYTMESSYCGCDQGKYRDQHMNTRILEEMGQKFCEALVRMSKTFLTYNKRRSLKNSQSLQESHTTESVTDIEDDEDILESVTTVSGSYQDDELNLGATSLFDMDLNGSDSEEDYAEDDEEANDEENLP